MGGRYLRRIGGAGAMNKVNLLALSAVLAGAVCLPNAAQARDLQGRLGLGFNQEFVTRQPAVSLKYALTRDLGFEAIVGAATTAPTGTTTALKIFKNLFFETNLNFYFAIGAGLLTSGGGAGAQFLAVFGAEFFVPGLESLGLSFETGASADTMSGGLVLRTLGESFLTAGIRFYF